MPTHDGKSPPSLRQLFDDNARYIWRCLRHLGVAEADVEDVCQEVFITAHRKLPEFEGRSSLRTWLYAICLRHASDYRRRAHVRLERPTAELPHADEEEHMPHAAAESRRLLQVLLSRLDADKREVVVLYELEGFTMKEVAEILECPLQTAYSRLHAGRERMVAAAAELEANHG